MSIYAVVENGFVVNLVAWDDSEEWAPENGNAIEAPSGVGIGWVYSDGAFTNPNTPPEPTDSERYDAELLAINTAYYADKQALAFEYLTAGLFDGTSEAAKKAAIYSKLQERNQKYTSDMNALDEKYGG
ncbi:hypothetical protein SLJ66_001931 [Escherichia coli]|nr:hypothetical protein [Escherichia coli]